MSITEMKTAIRKLPAAEVGELMTWLESYQEQARDKQGSVDRDAEEFDALISQAYASGAPTPLTKDDIDEARRAVKETIAARTICK